MNSVEKVLLENIDAPNSLFIFPTDIAASRWADHVLRLKGGTIAMNKFIAWDVFKQNSIKSKVQNKQSIPSALKKIFVNRLVRENAKNAALGEEPVFSSLIMVQWAGQASQFTSWLTGILPQLGAWFCKTTGLSIGAILSEEAKKPAAKFEGDDKDMFALARRYANFLEEHGLFEPAWETPPFNDEGKDVFIFFPESLSDYSEYREILAQSSHVKTISVSTAEEIESDTFFYTNSRSEITEAALYIRALNEKQNIAWDSIAVCIPDSEDYLPYVLREFANRNIPYVKRFSKPLAGFPAGSFFHSVLDVSNGNFSFYSLVSLIMNKNLPWKDTALIDKLIQFGIKNNCLYSWVEEKDGKEQYINVWEDAFKSPVDYFENDVLKFFLELKKSLHSFRGADSFAELRKQYFIFRQKFFDMDNCSDETDLVLSRCISELMYLVEIEKSYPDVPAADPFSFFCEYLNEVLYLPQSKTSGVAILPYKTAAAAPFDCHIILGSGHESLSVIYSRLNFLPRKKREELGINDEDASTTFINMHKFNSLKNPAFFCSEQTFSNFAIPHPKIGSPSEPRERYAEEPKLKEKFSQDYYNVESALYSSGADSGELSKLHENQLTGFLNWKDRRKQPVSDEKESGSFFTAGEEIKKIIDKSYTKNGKYRVSASSLQTYFQCSLKWLFERVFALENVQIDTSLMAENISGSVYHAILNDFFIELKTKDEPLLKPNSNDFGLELPPPYKKLLEQSINRIFNAFPIIKSDREYKISAITERLLHAGKKDYQEHLENCLAHFLSYFEGCSVVGSESYYTLESDSCLLNGYIDCILKDTSENTEKYIIVDFKRKMMPKRADCTTKDENPLTDFQLPMYITLAEENEKYKVYTALFYSILEVKPEVIIGSVINKTSDKIIPAKEEDRIERNSELYNRIFEEFKIKTNQFKDEISTGNFTVFPEKNSGCFDCKYQRICRTVYIISRENNTLEND
ncbi:MAG: PD-(D/E)XK nuclease family protein [Treponema sp.]|jgi:hypothetical protein|nr:PD-(D/E)XK nuclease family protein [Treponema sp.]